MDEGTRVERYPTPFLSDTVPVPTPFLSCLERDAMTTDLDKDDFIELYKSSVEEEHRDGLGSELEW